jgi:hypothetical protein
LNQRSVESDGLFGDPPVTGKEKNCRIVFNNIQGLRVNRTEGKIVELGKEVKELDVTVLALCETNKDWRFDSTLRDVKNAFKSFWQHCNIASSSSTERPGLESRSASQPGGTMTIVGHPLSYRTKIAEPESDMGRWNEMQVEGKRGKSLILITAYRVCKNTIASAGPSTSFAQQWHILRRAGHDCPDPRKQFILDLAARVSAARALGHGVLVMLDANDSLQHFNNDFTKWVRSSNLVDIHVHRHGTEGEPNTHIRGSSRIDYMLLSPDLVEYVTAAGILPMYGFATSDHRALFCDIDLDSYLGGLPNAALLSSRRGLNSKDPHVVKKYREGVDAFLETSDFEARLDQVLDQIDDNDGALPPELARQLNELEAEFTHARLGAENACRRVHTTPWSPALVLAQNTLRFWKMWLAEKRYNGNLFARKKDFSIGRAKVWPKGVELYPNPTFATIRKEMKSAKEALYDVLLNADTLRMEHLEECARMAELEGRGKAAKALKNIIKAEKQQAINKKLSQLFGKGAKSGLAFLIVDRGDGVFELVTDPKEMEALLLWKFTGHFSQAKDTPWANRPLTRIFGPFGTNASSRAQLEGRLEDIQEELTAATRAALAKIVYELPKNSVSAVFTTSNFRSGIRKWKESTSTSPSGLHLGHDKAIMRMEVAPAPGETDTRLSERVFAIKVKFINAAIKHTHVFPRWMTIVNATIEKIPGKPLLNKLRVIHLIESDLNLIVGELHRRLMKQALEAGKLCVEQFGSIAGRKAIDPLALKHATYSIGRLSVTNYASVDNDAKSCFDRIVMLFASLVSQRLGMDEKACALFLKTLDSAKYQVKTRNGVSEGFYCSTEEKKIHGPGQGGRGSPAIWAIICCLIMECMPEGSTGIELIDPRLLAIIKYYTSGFVDDVTLWIGNLRRSLLQGETPEMLLQETTAAFQWWEQLLHATGGKLELTKCFYYLIYWVFDDDGIPRMMRPDELPSQVTITDSETQQPIPVTAQAGTTAHKTLGAMECPSGDNTEEIKRLHAKAKGLGQQVATSHLTQYEANLVLNSRIGPAMGYTLPVGTITEEQAHKMQGLYVRPLIQAMGFNACTPCSVVYAPSEIGGIGVRHLFSDQGAAKTRHILQQIRSEVLVGRTLSAMLQWVQVVAGSSAQVLVDTILRLPQIKAEKYVTTLRKYFFLSGMGLHVSAIATIKPKRVHDHVFMDRIGALRRDDISDIFIERFNRCRIFMRVETLADIVTADGKCIIPNSFQCDENMRFKSRGLWPKQKRVGIALKRTWQWYLRKLCKPGTLELLQPLGHWLEEPMDHHFNVYLDETTERVLIRGDNQNWLEYEIIGKERTKWRIRFTMGEISHAEWQDLREKIPLDIETDFNYLEGTATPPIGSSADWLSPAPSLNDRQTWSDYVASLPPCYSDLLKGCKETTGSMAPPLWEILASRHKTVHIASDGGHCGNRGSYGWVMSVGSKIVWQGKGHARGNPMHPYRAEAYGKIAWMTFILHYARFYNVEIQCTVQNYCDNKDLVKHSKFSADIDNVWDCMRADYDILREILWVQQELQSIAPNMRQGEWVKGHQDRDSSITRLSLPAILNVAADRLAKEVLSALSDSARSKVLPTLQWTQCKATLLLDGSPYTRGETHQLRWRWRESEFQIYLCSRWGMTETTLHTINWAGFTAARMKLTLAEKAFGTKLMIGWLATGTRMEKYGNALTECHRCGGRETTDHLFRCPETVDSQQDFLARLQEHLASIGTAPMLATEMIQGLQLWMAEENGTDYEGTQQERQQYTSSCQTKIGWNLFLRGVLASDWSIRQQAHMIEVAGFVSGNEADKWSSKVSLWLIRDAHQAWKARNEGLHKPTDPENSFTSRIEQELHRQIQDLYERQGDVNNQDRDLFNVLLPDRLKQSVFQKRAWLQSTARTMDTVTREYAADIDRTQRDIRTYMPPNDQAATAAAATARAATTIHSSSDSQSDSESSSDSSRSFRQRQQRILQPRQKRDQRTKNSSSSSSDNTNQAPDSDNSSVDTIAAPPPQVVSTPPLAPRFVIAKGKQRKRTIYNLRPTLARKKTQEQTQQSHTSQQSTQSRSTTPETTAQHTQHSFRTANESNIRQVQYDNRVWDSERTEREGGGSPAKTARFRKG